MTSHQIDLAEDRAYVLDTLREHMAEYWEAQRAFVHAKNRWEAAQDFYRDLVKEAYALGLDGEDILNVT